MPNIKDVLTPENLAAIALLLIMHVVFISAALRYRRPVAAAAAHLLLGAGTLFAAHVVLALFGVTLAINFVTALFALASGIPGVILMILVAVF